MKLVISLGGSLIVPNKIDYKYLIKFRDFIKKLSKKHKIVIVTGGGTLARDYIKAYQRVGKDESIASWLGIKSTKLNASLVNSFFGKLERLPDAVQEIKFRLEDKPVVICGGLGFEPHITSDANAAKIAKSIDADYFINLTNVNGLYNKDPKLKGAKLIKKITFDSFKEITDRIKYKPGQHFVLDQKAAEIIQINKIKTAIIHGKKLENIDKLIKNQKFLGTLIE